MVDTMTGLGEDSAWLIFSGFELQTGAGCLTMHAPTRTREKAVLNGVVLLGF